MPVICALAVDPTALGPFEPGPFRTAIQMHASGFKIYYCGNLSEGARVFARISQPPCQCQDVELGPCAWLGRPLSKCFHPHTMFGIVRVSHRDLARLAAGFPRTGRSVSS